MSRLERPDRARQALIAELAGDPALTWHVVGVAGTGMSALAQWLALSGRRVTGSDRALERGGLDAEVRQLEAAGIALLPQDGRGVDKAQAILTSTAVEAAIADLARARELGRPVIHRAELLGHLVRESPCSVGVAGTSGKSTVTAMIFEVLARTGRDPSLLAGGDALYVARRGLRGNAWRGTGPLVAETDESDGSLAHHDPAIGVVLNLHRDHMEPAEALRLFAEFARRCRDQVVVGEDEGLQALRTGARVAGFSEAADFRGGDLRFDPEGSSFRVRGSPVRVPLPGLHNAQNAIAALAVLDLLGVPLEEVGPALSHYCGVRRRFELVGERGGVAVIDDYAHNPRKIEAAIRAAQLRSPRVFVSFQPHGFGPTRFMRAELARRLADCLRPEDRMHFAPIYFAGGTVARDVASEDLAEDLRELGHEARSLARREDLAPLLASSVRPGDLVLLLGGRDPGLSDFARSILEALPGAAAAAG